MVNRFRKWLIRKLGGYTEQFKSDILEVKHTYVPIETFSCFTVIPYRELTNDEINKFQNYNQYQDVSLQLQQLKDSEPNSNFRYILEDVEYRLSRQFAEHLLFNDAFKITIGNAPEGIKLTYTLEWARKD